MDNIDKDDFYSIEEYFIESICDGCEEDTILGCWDNTWLCYECQLNYHLKEEDE